MAKQVINDFDSGLSSRAKINANFDELYVGGNLLDAANRTTVDESLQIDGMGMAPIRTYTTYTVTAEGIPISFIGQRLYGRHVSTPGTLYYSDDYAATWSLLQDTGIADTLRGVHLMDDGEVLLHVSSGCYKSSGWASNPATATWTRKVTTNSPASAIQSDFFTNGTKTIVAEYATSPRTPARYLWISTDSGDTFDISLDLDVMYPGQSTLTHWHGVGYDSVADRFWASNGDGAGTRGLYYSDDDGANWTLLDGDYQLLTITETKNGIICSSDEAPDGMYRVLRTDDPTDMVVELTYRLRLPSEAVPYTFGTQAVVNPVSGHVYCGWIAGSVGVPAVITGTTDGLSASEIFRIQLDGLSPSFDILCVSGDGKWLVVSYRDGATKTLVCQVPGYGTNSERLEDSGIAGGDAGALGIACGDGSVSAYKGTAIGVASEAAASGTNIGYASSSLGSSVAIGAATTANTNATVVGAASSGNDGAVVIGKGSQSTVANSIVIGNGRNCSFSNGIALGGNPGASDQVAVGARDIEIQASGTRGLILRDTNGARYRVTVNTSGVLVVTAL